MYHTPAKAGQTPSASDAKIRTLLGRLDLTRPELAAVQAAKDDPQQAAEALLAYYRARTTVKHPIDRIQRAAKRGQYATPAQIKQANDGVKHIFLCQPNVLPHDFGPAIDWFTNKSALNDSEWLWQLHRQYWWSDLARAYWHTGDEIYAQAWVAQMLDWVRACPRDAKSPAWRTLEAGIRGYSWSGHFQHFIDSPAFGSRELVVFLNACWEHGDYLTQGRRFSANNWGLMEAEGAAFLAITFPEFAQAPTWREQAVRHLAEQMGQQVRPDGHQAEQCLNYHQGCISWFSRTAELLKMNGNADSFPADFWKRLEQMCAVLYQLSFPDNTSPQFGDTHSPVSWQGELGKWAPIFGRDDFRYCASGGNSDTAPRETAFAFPDSGFYSMRSGWQREDTCLVVKCGPDGGWHCQPDNGTFELYAGGRRLMPDSGTYIYDGDAAAKTARQWFRQTRVHQTLTLDGKNTVYQPKLLRWQPGNTLDTLVVENAGYPQLTHRRAVFFVQKRFFVIIDEARGTAAGDVNIHFQLLPCTPVVEQHALSFRSALPTGANVLVQGMAQAGLTLQEEEGWVSYVYGHRGQRPAFRFTQPKTAAQPCVRFISLVVPYDGATPPETEVRLLDAADAPTMRLAVRVGDIRETITYTPEP